MSTPSRRLRAVKSDAEPATTRCQVAAQAVVTGNQDIRVQAMTPINGMAHGQIAVRVGRVLVYVTDRDALDSFVQAWQEAAALADKVFGASGPRPYRLGRGGRS